MSALTAVVSKLKLVLVVFALTTPISQPAGEHCYHTSSLISPVSNRLVVSATAVHASQLQAVLALAPEINQLPGSTAEGGRSSLPITGKHFYHRQPIYFSRLQVGSVTLARAGPSTTSEQSVSPESR